MRARLTLLTAFLSVLCVTAQAQRSTQNTALLQRSKPAVFITFERVDGTEVLLRLHNNTKWTISVPTEPPCVSSTQNAGPCLERSRTRLIDGRLAEVKYLTEPVPIERIVRLPCDQVSAPAPDDAKGLRIFLGLTYYKLTELPSGMSAVFAANQGSLGTDQRIYVPFVFEWDVTREVSGLENLQHRVYFSSADLPRAAP